ncbi:MAG: hypothetical protein JST11_31870, partial [Acidobacteria bacterium]|nr:hypothetical protein [Acidobacteriota bacterium]
MANRTTQAPGRRITGHGGLELALPNNEKGLGNLIGAPDSKALIEGVRAMPFPVYPDDRGYFLEVQRIGRG